MTQPWATLVAIGENRIETRSWPTSYRGQLAIHTARSFPREARELCAEAPFREVLAEHGFTDRRQLPTGVIIAHTRLDDVVAFDDDSAARFRAQSRRGLLPRHEVDFGDVSRGRYGFVLSHVRPLAEPIAARGTLGLWEVPAPVARQLDLALSSLEIPNVDVAKRERR
jgi:activating signal cointegrator 1